MITLDQIKQLDLKVRKAIDKINSLKSENNMLQEKLDNYQLRIEELEILIDTFKEDQGEIENGIIEALHQLDILEDTIISTGKDSGLAQEPLEADNQSLEKSDTETVADQDSSNTESSNEEETSDLSEGSLNSEIELDIF